MSPVIYHPRYRLIISPAPKCPFEDQDTCPWVNMKCPYAGLDKYRCLHYPWRHVVKK
jgi:hypothetical protein